MRNKEQNRALAAALRAADVVPNGEAWSKAKQLLGEGLTYEQVAAKVSGKVSEPTPKYNASRRASKASAKARQAKPRKAPKRQPGRVRENVVAYNDDPDSHTVLLTREGVERTGELKVWAPRPKANGQQGVTHTVALLVDGAAQAFTMSKRALKNLMSGRGTLVWYAGEGHLATLVAQ